MAKIMKWDLGKALVEAGVLTQEECNRTNRVIIDSGVKGPPTIYIQQYIEDGVLDKLTPLFDGMDVVRGET